MREALRTSSAGILFLVVATSGLAQVPIKTTKPDGTPNKAAWMAQGGYGMMVHYLIKPEGDTPEERTGDLNRTLDNFDLDHFIKQFDETGADWLIFTLAQGTGYLSSKSEFIDNLEPGITPNRELILEIGRRLHQGGKRMIIYPPGQGNIIVTADRKLRKRDKQPGFYMPDSQFIDNVQWHCLLPIDLTFNPAVPNQYCHYTDKELFKFVDDVKSVGGAITINVPIDRENGHVPEDTHSQLARLGKHLKNK